ncbi:DUF2109 domain-containing protein [Methanobrevibacter olleyae]|uniref:Energy-converting hydrogenase A subunit C n=1 Tax=Methanobrevibacter olleyae TaxID=294671 RepID=A0A126R1F0_METOL|nr:DUF2109 domain-containing protein [Methanobrevibacter olleyae]AMK15465.1 energy-converting hydrogenase A subunit C EhaC [Methanobrevibacter olleyae]SFL56990.1 energy-converting hydrogenase A subunit C [Methanobrevibacter olleyae]
MYIEIIGVITVLMALRALITKNMAEKLLYINVIGFCVSALIALYIQSAFGLVLAATFFISSTIGANAIAYSLKDLEGEITYDENMQEHKEN